MPKAKGPTKPKAKPKAPTKKEQHENLLQTLELFPAVAVLPMELQNIQKVWFNRCIIEFGLRLASCGSKEDNGTTYTHDQFVNGFCKEMYPDLTEEEREQYYLIIGPKVYSYLTNHHKHQTSGIKLKDKAPLRSRLYGQDFWVRENKDDFKARLERHKLENPGFVLTIGQLRSVTGKFFKELPQDVRERYQTKAKEELRRLNTVEPLEGEAKEEYVKSFPRKLAKLLQEAETAANILVFAQVLMEQSDGVYTLKSALSDGMKSFGNTSSMGMALELTKGWVEETVGKHLEGGPPPPAVYPNTSNDLYPTMPPYASKKLAALQKFIRAYFIKIWQYCGGTGKVPWEQIRRSVEAGEDTWFDKTRIPAGATWTDPGSMKLHDVLLWCHHFTDEKLAPEHRFQFKTTLSANNPSTIPNPQFSSSEPTKRREQDVWALHFTETVTSCQLPGGMRYSKESWAYGTFLATGDCRSFGVTLPAEWKGLPAFDPNRPAVVMPEEELSPVQASIDALPVDDASVINKLVAAVNNHEAKIPASTYTGIWSHKDTLPHMLPSTLPTLEDSSKFIGAFWLPKSYFEPPIKHPASRTFAYLEDWQEKARTTVPFVHEESGTFLGGDSGLPYMVRGLILIVLNLAVAKRLIEPPVPIPSGYDLSRLPIGEYDRVLGWCREWLELIEASAEILEQTFEARTSDEFSMSATEFAACVQQEAAERLTEGEILDEEMAEGEEHAAEPRVAKSKKRAKASKGKTPKGSKGKKAEDEDEEAEMPILEEESGGEENYDVLDPSGSEMSNPEDSEGSDDAPDRPYADEEMDVPVKQEPVLDDEDFGGIAQYIVLSREQTPVSVMSYQTDSTELATRPKVSAEQHIFGAPPIWQAPVWAPIHGVGGLVSFGRSVVTRNEELKKRWADLRFGYGVATEGERAEAKNFKSTLEPIWWPLIEFIRLRKLTWITASEAAPHALEFMRSLQKSISNGSHFISTVDRFMETIAGRPDYTSLDALLLREIHRNLTGSISQHRLIWEELKAAEQICTHWANETMKGWEGDIPDDPQELKRIGQGLLFWAIAYEEQLKADQNNRDALCAGLVLPLSSFQACWYQFGNLSKVHIVDGVTEALEYQADPTAMFAQPDMPSPKQAEPSCEHQTKADNTSITEDSEMQVDAAVGNIDLVDEENGSSPHGDKAGVPLGQVNAPVASHSDGPPVVEQPVSKSPVASPVLPPATESPAPSVKSAVVEPVHPPVTGSSVPFVEPPAAEPPVVEPPVVEPPVVEPPVVEPAPASALPVAQSPVPVTPATPAEGTRAKRGQKRKVGVEDTGEETAETGGSTAKMELARKTRSQRAGAAADAASSTASNTSTRKLRSKK